MSSTGRKAQFFVFKAFLLHIKEHASSLNTTCTKCRQKTTASTIHKHLVHCHGYGMNQCVYCRFGTNAPKIISQHIANEHPSMMPFFCERSERSRSEDLINGTPSKMLDPTSIESTRLQRISHSVIPQCFVDAPSDEIVMRNYSNIGDLGHSSPVQGIIGRQMSKIISPKQPLLEASRPTQLPAGTKIQIHPKINFTATSSTPTLLQRPAQPLKPPQQQAKMQPATEIKVRSIAELQEPVAVKTMPESCATAPKSEPPTAAPAKKVSIFKKKADPNKLKALKDELWPSWALKSEPRPGTKMPGSMPGLTSIGQRPSLTAGAPRQLLKGSLAHQRSSLPASSTSSLTAGEILKKSDGPSTQFVKSEESTEKEAAPQPFGLQIENVFSFTDQDFGDLAWDPSDLVDPAL